MTANEEFLKLVRTSFPVEPLPGRFFWAQGASPPQGDIPEELHSRIARRRWTEIKARDWAMVGAPPCIAREYLEPAAFLYYLPSLLLDALREPEYLPWAVEAVLPSGRKWWSEFLKNVSPGQRATLSAFLASVRSVYWNSVGPATQAQISSAEAVWCVD